MPSLAGAVAVASQVERESAKTVLRHSIGKSAVTPCVLPKSVDDSECDLAVRQRPRPIRQLGAVDRVD